MQIFNEKLKWRARPKVDSGLEPEDDDDEVISHFIYNSIDGSNCFIPSMITTMTEWAIDQQPFLHIGFRFLFMSSTCACLYE